MRFHTVEQILAARRLPDSPVQPVDALPGRLIDRVAFAIPRMGARVPWKGTCLVQALAAQRWLARRGIGSEIVLGARKGDGSGLDAHAWLVAGGRTVIGGDVEGYQPFRPSRRR